MKRTVGIALFVPLLVACGPAPQPAVVVVTVVVTATPQPTDTPTLQLTTTPTATLTPATALLPSDTIIQNWEALGLQRRVTSSDCPYPMCQAFESTSGVVGTVVLGINEMIGPASDGTAASIGFDLPVTIPDPAFSEAMALFNEMMGASGVGQDVTVWIGDFGSAAIGTGDFYSRQFDNVGAKVFYADGMLIIEIADLDEILPTWWTISIPTPAVTATTRPTAAPRTSFGDGVWLIGVDIAPGTYRTTLKGGYCMWERLSGLSGTYDDVIAFDSPDGGQALVTIAPSDVAFSTDGCGEWGLLP